MPSSREETTPGECRIECRPNAVASQAKHKDSTQSKYRHPATCTKKRNRAKKHQPLNRTQWHPEPSIGSGDRGTRFKPDLTHTKHTGEDGVAKRSRRTRAEHEVPWPAESSATKQESLPQDLIDGRPPHSAGTGNTGTASTLYQTSKNALLS